MGALDDFKNFVSDALQAVSSILKSIEQEAEDAKSTVVNTVRSAIESNPAQKTGKLSPVDQLYKIAGKDGFPEDKYQDLIAMLSKINSDIVNNFSVSHHEYTDSSYLAATRSQRDRAGESKTLKKNKVYGVVLKTIIRGSDKVIYIDVPPWNTKLINHPDDISVLDEKQLKEYEDLIFFPESSMFSAPSPLRLAVVEIPANFPNHTAVNPQDAVYKELYSSDQIIASSTRQKKTGSPGQSNLPAGNSSLEGEIKEATYSRGVIKKLDTATFPAAGLITSLVGPRSGRSHEGVDIAASIGTPIYCVEDGVVLKSFKDQEAGPGSGFDRYGKVIFIDHGSYATLYAHCSEVKVSLGDSVKKNQLIGLVGNTGVGTGPHLHFEKRAGYSVEERDVNGKKIKLLLNNDKGKAELPYDLMQIKANQQPTPQQNNDQSIPVAQISKNNNQAGKTSSIAVNKPKMLLVDFQVDTVTDSAIYNRGSSVIKVREDIIPDLKQIKKTLNNYNIPFTCNAININLNNKNLSDFARVGLEINLNINAALTVDSTDDDIYYISQDKNNNLRVYTQARKNLEYLDKKYTPINKELEIYNIRNTYLKKPPELKKVFKPVLDLTKIFEDFGFHSVKPEYLFFSKSDNIKSNWFVFYKPAKLNIGYSYRDLLTTIYYNNDEQIWDDADRKWDGKKFS